MAHIFRPGIAETTTTSGTNDIALGGRVYGALAGFFDVMSVADTCDYVIRYGDTREEGIGTRTAGGVLERTSVSYARHANGTVDQNKVSFASGMKHVFMTVGADRVAAFLDALRPQSFTQGQRDQANANLGNFLSGTKVIFPQASAPTGWTRDTTHNDKAIRIVSGSGGGSGGSSAFSTVFGLTATSGTAIGQTHLPAGVLPGSSAALTNNDLAVASGSGIVNTTPGSGISFYQSPAYQAIGPASTIGSLNLGGGGAAHTHPIELRVNYVDCIIATKD